MAMETAPAVADRGEHKLKERREQPPAAPAPEPKPAPIPSPFRYAVALTCSGASSSLIVIWLIGLIEAVLHLSPLEGALVGTVAIFLIMLPPLYFLMLRPMKTYVAQQEASAQALAEANSQLEARVRARTSELNDASLEVQRSLNFLEEIHRETMLLSELIELLQASRTTMESEEMLRRFGQRLFPIEEGAIYIYRSSRNILEKAASWGEKSAMPDTFPPEDCWALRRGRQHMTSDVDTHPRCKHLVRGTGGSTTLCVPMMAQGDATGVLVLQGTLSDEEPAGFPPGIRRLAVSAAEQIALALANLQLREKLRDQAIRDPLTAMFNRRYFEETAERELRRAHQAGTSAGVIMLDIDHFKRLNDTRGHDAGDVMLRRIGLLLQSRTRVEDIACRYGGEEFILLLPGVSIDVLISRAEQIREAVKDMDVRFRGEMLGGVTVSCGAALYPDHGANWAEVTEAADRALYRAKQSGRDRVEVAS